MWLIFKNYYEQGRIFKLNINLFLYQQQVECKTKSSQNHFQLETKANRNNRPILNRPGVGGRLDPSANSLTCEWICAVCVGEQRSFNFPVQTLKGWAVYKAKSLRKQMTAEYIRNTRFAECQTTWCLTWGGRFCFVQILKNDCSFNFGLSNVQTKLC